MTAAQTQTGAEFVTRRTASMAVIPASGTQPTRITSIASHGLPASTVAIAAITASQGGVAVVEPSPNGWNDWRYLRHRSDAPPQAGTSAPPPSGPAPSSDRPATSATTSSSRNVSSVGLVR